MSAENIAYTKEYETYYRQYDYIFYNKYYKKQEEKILNDSYYIIIKYYSDLEFKKNISAKTIEILDSNKNLVYNFNNIEKDDGFCKIFTHQNGCDYIVFKRDIYGYSVLNLSTMEDFHYYPKSSLEGKESFIWSNVHYNKNNSILAISGYTLNLKKDLVLVDFYIPTKPMLRQILLSSKIDFDGKKYGDIVFNCFENNSLCLKCFTIENEPARFIDVTLEEDYYIDWF